MKKTINEAQLKKIVAKSVAKVLKESITDGAGYADGLDSIDNNSEPVNPREVLEDACERFGMCDKAFKEHNYEEAYARFKQGYNGVCRALAHLDDDDELGDGFDKYVDDYLDSRYDSNMGR